MTVTIRPQVNFALVHGTWGRGIFFRSDAPRSARYWFNENSKFRQRLEEQLTQHELVSRIDCVNWSGDNSVVARAEAAKTLGDYLSTQPEDVPIVVIAHSHAGNIALRALGHLNAARRNIHVVTLAAPFVQVVRSSSPLFGTLLWFVLPFMFLTPFALVAAFLGFEGWATTSAATLGVIGFLWLGIQIVSAWRRPKPLDEAACFSISENSRPKLLAIRGFGDEASLIFGVGRFGAWGATFLIRLYLVVAIPVLVLLSVLGRMLSVDDTVGPVLVLAFAPIPLLLLLPGIFLTVLGKEFLAEATRYDVTVESVPDTAHAATTIVTLAPFPSPALLALGHSIYNHPDCAKEIVAWIKQTACAD